MTTPKSYPKDKGLNVGSKAPSINTEDIEGNKITLDKLLDNSKAIMIDFFRGAW